MKYKNLISCFRKTVQNAGQEINTSKTFKKVNGSKRFIQAFFLILLCAFLPHVSFAAITGTTTLCPGDTATLHDTATLVSWSSSNTAVATIGSGTGRVTAISAGTATITYFGASGYTSYATVTVNPAPAIITGMTAVCPGSTVVLADASSGGTWSSSNIGVAIIGTSGIVTGVAAGNATITYSNSYGCIATTIATVHPNPTAITGPTTACSGASATLSDAAGGGAWSSGSTGIATISATGVYTGLAVGIVTISYTLPTGCYTTTVVTINPNPPGITGTTTICTGTVTTLSDTYPGGAWSCSAVVVATISSGTGVVTGVSAGTATITYTLPTGCSTTGMITVATLAGITGTSILCVGVPATLTDVTTGGTWTSSSVVIAYVGSSTGIVTGTSTGVAIISYTLAAGCTVIHVVTVNPLPNPSPGFPTVCAGNTLTLSDSYGTGDTWSSSDTAVATITASGVDTGIITGIAAGTAIITCTASTGCYNTQTVTVNPAPAPITGASVICLGSSGTLSDATPGGIWSSTSTGVASIGATTGIVTGVSAGSAIINYTLGTCATTFPFTIAPPIPPSSISSPGSVCMGATGLFSDSFPGGIWISSNPAIATITPGGMLSGVSAGIAIITYTLPSGCFATAPVTINPAPAPISGTFSLCEAGTATLSDVTAGGTWSSASVAASIDLLSGLVTAVSSGTSLISYTISSGCITTAIITVNPNPASITGAPNVCIGLTSPLSDTTPGGLWSTSDASIAGIGVTSGFVTGGAAGMAYITYSLATGCYSSTAITVSPAPFATLATPSICVGGTDTLYTSPAGCSWSISSSGIATIGGSGIITGISAGVATIFVTSPAGCIATVTATVSAVPAAIAGNSNICTGAATALTDATPGGTWQSSDSLVATVGATGIAFGVNIGTLIVSYTTGTGCYTTFLLNVIAAPAPITGSLVVCAGNTINLDDVTAGGTWGSSDAGIATIATIGGSTGVVTGMSTGIDTITYALGVGCIATTMITVDPAPSITAGSGSVSCGGMYLATAGGGMSYSWSPATGVSCSTCASTLINPDATTTYIVTGTTASGCTNTASITLNGNRISGHVIAGGSPADTMKVWLIQYNATDSTLIAMDSTLTCMDGGIPYYEFDGTPAGNYMVKAKLLSSVPGTPGYIPTYGLSSPHWDSAATIVHSSTSDTQHISMIYGVVPPGPGFIGGYIVSGAGKGTAVDVPAVGMLVYLMNTSGHVLSYTYTDAGGHYSFSSVGNGSYIVYPEDYHYYTTPSSVITINAASETDTNIDFKQHTTLHTITPFDLTGIHDLSVSTNPFKLYPNPADSRLNISWSTQFEGGMTICISDMTGRIVSNLKVAASANMDNTSIDISGLNEGIYVVMISNEHIKINNKLTIAHHNN